MKWLIPDPRSASPAAWMQLDYFAGAFYIVVGTLWYWVIGKMISRIATRRQLNEVNEIPARRN
jgi:hypothetical protein